MEEIGDVFASDPHLSPLLEQEFGSSPIMRLGGVANPVISQQ